MSEQDFSDVVKALMTDHDYQNVNARTVDLWLLLCACQAMQRSTLLHDPLKAVYKDLGKRLQAIVLAIHPDAKALAEAGWNEAYDFIRAGNGVVEDGPRTLFHIVNPYDVEEENSDDYPE